MSNDVKAYLISKLLDIRYIAALNNFYEIVRAIDKVIELLRSTGL